MSWSRGGIEGKREEENEKKERIRKQRIRVRKNEIKNCSRFEGRMINRCEKKRYPGKVRKAKKGKESKISVLMVKKE